ncbi:MAG: hypothetical protein KKD44_26220 [Proteobacteria bacterium]|nr:hypothetical protein [Pseudomonadota bacterium]
MRIIGYHFANGILTDSDSWVQDKEGYLTFLLSKSSPDTIQIAWHLDWMVAELLRCLEFQEWEGKKLLDNGKIYTTPWTLSYFPGRLLTIDRGFGAGHPFAILASAAQYQVPTFDDIPTEHDKLYEYCIKKAKEAKELGEKVYQALTELDLHPKSLISPIAVYQKEILSKVDLPTVDDYPDEIGEWAYECCKGSWVECFKRGHWKETWDYDINSAYPSVLRRLPDLRRGTWSKRQDTTAILGFNRTNVDMTADLHPILFRNKDDENFTPVGMREECLTWNECNFIDQRKLGKVESLESWGWTPTKSVVYPLASIIDSLYQEREKAVGNSIKRDVIKRILSGIYGKLLEIYLHDDDPMGPLFNPVWAAYVEADSRLEVANFCYKNDIVPIHIAVDGILSDKPLPVAKNGIGSWQLSSIGPALVFGSGAVAQKNHKGIGDFALDYDEMISFMKINPDTISYTMKKFSPMTLPKALSQNKWDKLGQLLQVERTVDFGYETKRCWPKMYSVAKDLLEREPIESVAWDVSLVSGISQTLEYKEAQDE